MNPSPLSPRVTNIQLHKINGTRRPNGVLVWSLYQPAIGCTSAATIRPLKPKIPTNVFFAPSGATVRTKVGSIMVSIAIKKPVMPNPKLLSDSKAMVFHCWFNGTWVICLPWGSSRNEAICMTELA